jgi:hypothetical protein
MNTWASYADGSAAQIVLHSVPPLVVFVAAEAVTDLRDKLTDAVHKAFTETAHRVEPTTAVEERAADVHEPARPIQHRTFADYLEVARGAYRPGVVVTPAWVRRVSGCSRGLSSRLAATLRAEVDGGVVPS